MSVSRGTKLPSPLSPLFKPFSHIGTGCGKARVLAFLRNIRTMLCFAKGVKRCRCVGGIISLCVGVQLEGGMGEERCGQRTGRILRE